MTVMKRANRFRQTAQPTFEQEPLLVRLCAAFVEHLGVILKTTMLFATALFVQELQLLFSDSDSRDGEPVSPTVIQTERAAPPQSESADDPVLSEGVLHALNCTYTDYRETHFDECVEEPSAVYPRPIGDDPGGAWNPDQRRPVLLARVTYPQAPR